MPSLVGRRLGGSLDPFVASARQEPRHERHGVVAGLELDRVSCRAACRLDPCDDAQRVGATRTGDDERDGARADLVGLAARDPLDISGEGPVDPPDQASIDASIELSGLPLQINITRVGDEVFVGALGQDFRVDLPPEQVALLDFGSLYPTLVGWMASPTEDGREEIDGTETVKVSGEIDPVRALGSLAPLLGGEAPTAAQARAALRQGTVDAWIGTEDLLPRRVHLVLDADAARIAEGVGQVNIDLTATMSAWGEPVDIQAPANPRELNTDQLGGLFGG